MIGNESGAGSGIQVISMVRILAGIAPGYVHCAGCQIHDNRADGFLTVYWVGNIFIMIANCMGVIDMVTLNGL